MQATTRPFWIPFTIVVWLIAAVASIVAKLDPIASLDMPDTDDAQRLVQVRDWLGGQAWGDVDQYRMNPPAGGNMHWSRIVDLPIAAIELAARPVVGQAAAERAAVALAPLLPLLFAMLMAGLAGWRLGGAKAANFAMLFLLATGPLLPLFAPLRIDHHNWQIALLLGVVALLADPARRFTSGVWAGTFAVAALMIGLEMLPHIVAASAALVVGWIVWPGLAPMLRGYGLALALGTLAAYPAFVPTARWMAAMCDAMSPVYLAAVAPAGAVALALPSLAALSSWPRRAAAAAIGFGAVAVAVLAAYPQCAAGPLAALDPQFLPVLSRISEARTLLSHLDDKPATIVYYALYPFVGLACGLWLCGKAEPEQRFPLAMLLFVLAASSVLMFVQLRAVTGPNAIAAILAGTTAALLLPKARAIESMLPRLAATVVLLVGLTSAFPTFAALGVGKLTGTDEPKLQAGTLSCTSAAAMLPLTDLPAATVASAFDMGPALLLHTPHTVVAGPYHRNAESIADSVRLWRAGDADAQAILRKYGATYVLGCTTAADLKTAKREAAQGLWSRLDAGNTPAWLERLPLPANSPYRLYRVKG